MRIFIGFLMIALGTLTIIKTEWIVRNFGYSEFGESKLRSFGGTRLLWKLIGMIATIAGMLVVANLHGRVILAIFGSLFGGLQQTPGN